MSATKPTAESRRLNHSLVVLGMLLLALALHIALAIPIASANRIAKAEEMLQQSAIRVLQDADEITAGLATPRLATAPYSAAEIRAFILSRSGDVLAEALDGLSWRLSNFSARSISDHPLLVAPLSSNEPRVDIYTTQRIVYRGVAIDNESLVVLLEIPNSTVIRPIRQLAEIGSIVGLLFIGMTIPILAANLVGLRRT